MPETKLDHIISTEDIDNILSKLEQLYPNPKTELIHQNPYQLVIATILSAQSTDKMVNQLTPDLFLRYPTPKDLAMANIEDVHSYLNKLGFYRNKSKSIIETSKILLDKFDSQVPRTLEELVTLPGVGRKTANVVLSNAFNIPAIAVDTHVFRVSKRIGFSSAKNVEDAEIELMRIIPRDKWISTHNWLILHGRKVCKARKPDCQNCDLKSLCLYNV